MATVFWTYLRDMYNASWNQKQRSFAKKGTLIDLANRKPIFWSLTLVLYALLRAGYSAMNGNSVSFLYIFIRRLFNYIIDTEYNILTDKKDISETKAIEQIRPLIGGRYEPDEYHGLTENRCKVEVLKVKWKYWSKVEILKVKWKCLCFHVRWVRWLVAYFPNLHPTFFTSLKPTTHLQLRWHRECWFWVLYLYSSYGECDYLTLHDI